MKPASFTWTPLHDVALIFLSMLHGADLELDDREVEAQRKRLRRWFPNAAPDHVQKAMNDVMLIYMGSARDQMVQTSAESLRQSLSSQQRVGILNDLADLASVDGVMAPGEVAFIQQLSSYWNTDAPPDHADDAS